MPEGWVWTKLGEISNYGECQNVDVKTIENDAWTLELEDIEKDSGKVLTYHTIASRPLKGVRHKFCMGDVLYGKLRTYLNKVLVAYKGGYCTTEIIPIRFSGNVYPEYMCHVLRSKYFLDYTTMLGFGVKMPRLSTDDAKKASIPLPPLAEQHRIVAEIERWFGVIDALDADAADLRTAIDQAKKKVLDLAIRGKLVPQNPHDEPASELLKRLGVSSDNRPYENVPFEVPEGWVWCKLTDICLFLSRGKSPKYSDKDSGYPVYAQKCNLKEGGISIEQVRFLDPETLCKWPEKFKLKTGDILVNSTGTGTVGRTRLFNENCLGKYPFVLPDSHVSIVRTHSMVSSEFIFYVLFSEYGQTYFSDNLAGSTNQKELYIGVLGNIPVPLPSLSEQHRIVEKIEEIFSNFEKIKEMII